MKKNYIQPAFEVTAVQSMFVMASESNPFGWEGQDIYDNQEPV